MGQLPLTALTVSYPPANGGRTSTTAPAGSGWAPSSRRTAVPSTSRLEAPSTRSSDGRPPIAPSSSPMVLASTASSSRPAAARAPAHYRTVTT